MTLSRGDAAVRLAAVTWSSAVAAAFCAWGAYDATPGPAAVGPPAPGVSAAEKPWRLTLYVHPHCPCSRASLGAFAELVASKPESIEAEVVFVRPAGSLAGWEAGELWDAAAKLPGACVRCDADGGEARRAGAATSGDAVLVGRDGRVAYRGGLTAGRGRSGDSPGRRAVRAALAGTDSPNARGPVFGCPLFSPTACPTGARDD